MGISIQGKWHLYIESPPCLLFVCVFDTTHCDLNKMAAISFCEPFFSREFSWKFLFQTNRFKFTWNLLLMVQLTKHNFFYDRNAFEDFVCKQAATLFRPQCVKTKFLRINAQWPPDIPCVKGQTERNTLTHWSYVMHICISGIGHKWLR